jgi:hypothetical protein
MRYFRLVACAAIMLLISGVANAQQDFINNFAGGGPNNVPALTANLDNPTSTATDNAGNYYIVDPSQERVFKVDSSGTLTVVAGDGFYGYGGDGGPATQAELYLHTYSQAAVDSNGNLYISDTYNCVVRMVTKSTGIISTFAGTPRSCGFGGDGGSATAPGAYLYYPYGLAVDGTGNVFISDTGYNRIRQVNTSGIINTVAGNGTFCSGSTSQAPCGDGGPATSASIGTIYSLAVDGVGNVFLVDNYPYNAAVRMFTPGGNISTVAGSYYYLNGNIYYCSQYGGNPCGDGGLATSAFFYYPQAVASDASGNVFIADFYNYDVREVVCADSAATCTPRAGTTAGDVYTVAGTGGSAGNSGDGGPSTSATLQYAYGISVDGSDNMFIPSYSYLVVREAALGGNINTVAGNGTTNFTGNNIQATDAVLNNPWGVAFDSSGNAYIADRYNCIVRKVDTSGVITVFAGTAGQCGFGGDGGSATASGVALLYQPTAVATDSAGNVYIADFYNYRIRKVDTTGMLSTFAGSASYGFSGDTGPATSAAMTYPYAVAADAAGNVYIADTNNYRIRKVDTTGTINTIAGNGGYGFSGDGGLATNAMMTYPYGVAVDKAGNVYFTDEYNWRVRRVNPAGVIDTFAGNGAAGFEGDGGFADQTSLYYPQELAVDPAGDVIIADQANQRIRLVDGQGLIHTVAGNGSAGYSGPEENILATTAELYNPTGVGVDSSGNIYIGDTANNLVRVVSAMANINASRYDITFDLQPAGKISSAQQVILSATGPISISSITASANFLESDNCGGITSGQTCVLNIYFKPPASGTFTGTVTVASNSFFGSPLVINLTGKGTAIVVTPTALTFKSTNVGTTATAKNVKVTNKGATTLTFGAVTASGDFHLVPAAITPCSGTLAAGASCNFAVNFKPTMMGLRTGSLTINDSDGSSPQFASLSGTGAGNGASVSPTKLTFASQPLNSFKSKPVTLTYNGTGTLTINSVTITVNTGNSDFTVVAAANGATPACGSTLASGHSCAYKVTFTPTFLGTETSTLDINDTSSAGTVDQIVALTGTGQ